MPTQEPLDLLSHMNPDAEVLIEETCRGRGYTLDDLSVREYAESPYFASGAPNTEGPYVVLAMEIQ